MNRTRRNAALILTLAACALVTRPASAQGQDPASAAAPGVEPCHATVASADVSSWQTISAEGFTFCVPADWRVRGHTARGRGGQVSWGAGEYHDDVVRVETRVVSEGEMSAMEAQQAVRTAQTRSMESIGGRTVEVFRGNNGSRFLTRVQFTAPDAWVSGEASSRSGSDLALNIIRTVRFGSR